MADVSYDMTTDITEGCVRNILLGLGEDPDRDGLKDTPKRVEKSWKELYSGYGQKVEDVFTVFEDKCDEMIVLKNIEFFSTCEHHMLPFFGRCHIGYIPTGKVVGISKLARLLEIFSRRLQIQERIGQQVSEAIMEHLEPQGCGVVLEAQHLCMTARGVGKQCSVMTTSAMLGAFRKNSLVRAEFLQMIK